MATTDKTAQRVACGEMEQEQVEEKDPHPSVGTGEQTTAQDGQRRVVALEEIYEEKLQHVKGLDLPQGKEEAIRVLKEAAPLSEVLRDAMLDNAPCPIYLLTVYTKLLKEIRQGRTLHAHIPIHPEDVKATLVKSGNGAQSRTTYIIIHKSWTHGLYEFLTKQGLKCTVTAKHMVVDWSSVKHPFSE